MLSQSGTIVEWGECLPDCPQEDVTAVCVMEPGDDSIKLKIKYRIHVSWLYCCKLQYFVKKGLSQVITARTSKI